MPDLASLSVLRHAVEDFRRRSPDLSPLEQVKLDCMERNVVRLRNHLLSQRCDTIIAEMEITTSIMGELLALTRQNVAKMRQLRAMRLATCFLKPHVST